jgi:cation diffusion facilitator CzcD-associated flavoprotein CzcO
MRILQLVRQVFTLCLLVAWTLFDEVLLIAGQCLRYVAGKLSSVKSAATEDQLRGIDRRCAPVRRVCIIGGGVSGLISAKILREYDAQLHVDVFEQSEDLGGLWRQRRRAHHHGVQSAGDADESEEEWQKWNAGEETNADDPLPSREDPFHNASACYDSLTTNTSRDIMCFSDFPMPAHFPLHLTHRQVLAYLEAFVDHFQLRSMMHFCSHVTSVRRLPSTCHCLPSTAPTSTCTSTSTPATRTSTFTTTTTTTTTTCTRPSSPAPISAGAPSHTSRSTCTPSTPTPSTCTSTPTSTSTSASTSTPSTRSARWRVTIRQKGASSPLQRDYDAVLIANGHYTRPHLPAVPGLARFRGRVLHSQEYACPNSFRGKRVLVVGMGPSGAEIAAELSAVADDTLVVTRTPVRLLPKVVAGLPVDCYRTRALRLLARLPAWLRATPLLVDRVRVAFERVARRCSALGLPPLDPCTPPFAVKSAISSEMFTALERGQVRVRVQCLQRVEERRVLFRDGTSYEADVIIFCTGYRIEFPFLEPHKEEGSEEGARARASAGAEELRQPLLPVEEGRVRHLYRHLFYTGDPTLAVMGLPRSVIPFPLVELQARWVAGYLCGDLTLPSRRAMEQECTLAERRLGERHCGVHLLHKEDHVSYCDMLAGEARVRPTLLTHPHLATQLLFGPLHPAQYRLRTPWR